MTNPRIAFLDTETHDLDDPIPIEICMIDGESGNVFHQYYNPNMPIAVSAMAVHHIVDEDLVDMPSYKEFAFPDSIEYIIGHNVDFDWRALGCPNVKRICTLALARTYVEGLANHQQTTLMYYFFGAQAREWVRNAHSAVVDVQNLMRLWPKLLERMPAFSGIDDLWRLSEEARIPKRWLFGKHTGGLFSETPTSYLRWYLGLDKKDEYVEKAVKRALGMTI